MINLQGRVYVNEGCKIICIPSVTMTYNWWQFLGAKAPLGVAGVGLSVCLSTILILAKTLLNSLEIDQLQQDLTSYGSISSYVMTSFDPL